MCCRVSVSANGYVRSCSGLPPNDLALPLDSGDAVLDRVNRLFFLARLDHKCAERLLGRYQFLVKVIDVILGVLASTV